ncbi:MAG: geranylgeranyl reductase family protein [Thermoflexales bacterium]|nr:geranylgeranyl reductase family protein [Thermoflexales bacterium]
MRYDAEVLIVGAGPAGSALAAQLAAAGHDTLLIDKADFPRDKTCGDALTPRAVRALEQLGMLETVVAQAHRVEAAGLIAPSGLTTRVRFDQFLDGWPPYALVVPRAQLDNTLREFAIAKGVRFVGRCKVEGLFEADGRAGVLARQGDRLMALTARIVALAVGAHTGLLRTAGLLRETPPTIPAARGYWRNVAGDQDTLWFYFDRRLRLGYAWLFPTGDCGANVGLGLYRASTDQTVRSASSLLAEFLGDYTPLRERLSGAQPNGPARGFPIRTDFPPPCLVQNRFVLVGEACGLVNPVTGEGIDLALESGLLAAEAIAQALVRSGDVARGLIRYEQELRRRYAAYFREMRWLRGVVMRPRALDILIRKGAERPELMRAIVHLSLGLASPRLVLSWKVWRDVLF